MLLEKPFRFDTREHRIYLDHHLSNHKLLLRFLVTAVFFSRKVKGLFLSKRTSLRFVKDERVRQKGGEKGQVNPVNLGD